MIVDEAFAALFPKFSSSLAYLTGMAGARIGGSKGDKQAAETPPLSISDLNGAMTRITVGWEKAGSLIPKALIASPLVARYLVGKIPGGGELLPGLVVPFAEKDLIGKEGLHSVEYDYEAAYAAMGRKAGEYVRNLMKKGQYDASGGMVFQPDFMRHEDALSSFTKAYEAEAGADRLSVRILDPGSLAIDPFGATKDAVAGMMESGKAVLVVAVDDASAAKDAVAGITAAIVMVDMSTWDDSRSYGISYRYSIRAEEKSLANAAKDAATRLAGGQAVPEITKVPLRFGPTFLKIF